MKSFRLVDANGVFVRQLTQVVADHLVAAGTVKQIGKGKATKYELVSRQTVEHYRGGAKFEQGLRTTYEESLDTGSLVTLKRLTNDGRLREWDPDLTFDDLRCGRQRHYDGRYAGVSA